MHKTLVRQVKHSLGNDPVISPEWQDLLNAVSQAYEDFDKDRILIERSLEISSSELKELVSLLRATLDSVNQGILVIDSNGKVTNYNKRYVEIWRIPARVMDTRDSEQIMLSMQGKVSNPDAFSKNFKRVAGEADEYGFSAVKLTDGRTIEMSSKSHLVEDASVGRVWSFADITEHLKTEDELRSKLAALERLNKAMIDRELKMIELKKKIRALEGVAVENSEQSLV